MWAGAVGDVARLCAQCPLLSCPCGRRPSYHNLLIMTRHYITEKYTKAHQCIHPYASNTICLEDVQYVFARLSGLTQVVHTTKFSDGCATWTACGEIKKISIHASPTIQHSKSPSFMPQPLACTLHAPSRHNPTSGAQTVVFSQSALDCAGARARGRTLITENER